MVASGGLGIEQGHVEVSAILDVRYAVVFAYHYNTRALVSVPLDHSQ